LGHNALKYTGKPHLTTISLRLTVHAENDKCQLRLSLKCFFIELEVESTHYIVQVATFGSTLGEESPEETLQRIAQGQFGGRVNRTASGGGTYSPPLKYDFNPFEE
jgi:hypothetical protein